MNIQIEKRAPEQIPAEPYKEQCGDALDALWAGTWVRRAIAKTEESGLSGLAEIAAGLQQQSDLAVVVASGITAAMIRAAADALPVKEGGIAVKVFGDSLSSGDYTELLQELSNRDFSLIAVTAGEEELAFRSAFAVMKRALIDRYGQEGAAERMIAIAGRESKILAPDAAESDYPVITYPAGICEKDAAGTAAVLLPLAVMNQDIGSYLNGFYTMLASPMWDLDGADYAAYRRTLLTEKDYEEILIWQKELQSFGRWMSLVNPRAARVLSMPADKALAGQGAIQTLLTAEKGEEDVMTPYFEGCNEDGSLNLLLLSEAAEDFAKEEKAASPGVRISVEFMDEFCLGQLFAFAQLSNGITEFLFNN